VTRKIRVVVLILAAIAGSLSFAHLQDLAEAAGQTGWKAWAYPVSVDLLLVCVLHRLRADRSVAAWFWFLIALVASLGANIATAGVLDLEQVPAWLRILVAGWPALAFLGGTLLVHSPTDDPATTGAHAQAVDEPAAVEVDMRRDDPAPPTAPELPAARPEPAAPAVTVPVALLDHARKIAEAHRATTGTPMDADVLSARLGLPGPMSAAIAAQLQLT